MIRIREREREKIRLKITYVRRLYMIKKHALTHHTTEICICSTTRTILEPYARVLISWGVKTTWSAGLMRLLLVVATIFIVAMSTVSQAYTVLDF